MAKDTLDIELSQNLKSFSPEIIFKLFIIVFAAITIDNAQFDLNIGLNEVNSTIFIPTIIVVLNVVITGLTIFSTGRRRIGILNYYKTKILSHKKYGSYNLQFDSNYKSSAFRFIAVIGALLFTCINFICIHKGYNEDDTAQIILNLLVLALSFCSYYFLIWVYRHNWISKKIKYIRVNGKQLKRSETKEIVSFLNYFEEIDTIHYLNDSLIHNLENNANVFKQRLDTLLLESVFIGALAFGTFIQITSPESMEQFGPASKSKGFFKEWVTERWIKISGDFDGIQNEFKLDEGRKSEEDQNNEWTEQEYFFIIAMGSLVCSILYISVLLKRFPIIKSIEGLFMEIKSAQTWNQREEDMLIQEVKAEIENSPILIKEKMSEKKQYYTARLQEKLAYCQLKKNKIETNLKIISTIRTIGLYTFFFVLLTATSMISPNLTIIFILILAYSLIGGVFMQEEGKLKKMWEQFTGNENMRQKKELK